MLCQPKVNKMTYGQTLFSYYGTHMWNSFPNTINLSIKCGHLKTLIKHGNVQSVDVVCVVV